MANFITKYKARIVTHKNKEPLTDKDYYTTTLAFKIWRTLIALANTFNLTIRQLNAVNAFLNTDTDRDIYCHFPEDYEQKGFVLQIKKALYGLRKSPKL